MRFESEEAFAKAYKEEAPKGVCLLCGSESYLIEAWRKRILERFGGEEGFNLQRLDGRNLDLDSLYDATQTLPLFAEEKCVLVDDLDPQKLGAEGVASLSAIFAECPPECLLLITGRPPLFDPKSQNGKKLASAADKAGWAVELGPRTGASLGKFLQQLARREGCAASPELCRELMDAVGSEMLTLSREMEKLCAYAGGGELTSEQLRAVAIPRTEARVFDLSRAIAAGNGQRAMELLGDLFFLRESPIAILATLTMAYADLYRARSARDRGLAPAQAVALFGYKGREFRMNNAYKSRMFAPALRKSLDLLLECDLRMKSTSSDGRVLLEQTVAGLLALGEA